MRVAITQRHMALEKGADRDALDHDYIQYYPSFGMTLVPVSNVLADPVAFVKEMGCEALILVGGNGVMPQLYGDTVRFPNSFSEQREKTEKALVDWAVKEKIPVFGICRGLHFLNVYFGGKLLQNIKEELKSNVEHVAVNHHVDLVGDDVKKYFGDECVEVNSFHNQGITSAMLSSKLRAFAVCDGDKTIEAAYHPTLPIAAVTWHPERKSPDPGFNEVLVRAFVERKLFWKK